jgi:hypothetical protein
VVGRGCLLSDPDSRECEASLATRLISAISTPPQQQQQQQKPPSQSRICVVEKGSVDDMILLHGGDLVLKMGEFTTTLKANGAMKHAFGYANSIPEAHVAMRLGATRFDLIERFSDGRIIIQHAGTGGSGRSIIDSVAAKLLEVTIVKKRKTDK